MEIIDFSGIAVSKFFLVSTEASASAALAHVQFNPARFIFHFDLEPEADAVVATHLLHIRLVGHCQVWQEDVTPVHLPEALLDIDR